MPNKIDKINRDSPLVKAVLALDNHLAELERVGTKINSTDMSSDVDLEHIQKLLTRFAECGQGVSAEVTNLSIELQAAQTRAETIAQGVSRQADLFNTRRNEHNEKVEQFRVLGDRVRELTTAIGEFRPQKGQTLTSDDRSRLAASVPGIETQLDTLIGELQSLRQSARDSRMRSVERNAESLGQTLEAVRAKLRELGS